DPIHPDLHPQHGRFLAWNFEKSGLFSVRSAYRMLVNTKRRREAWLDEHVTTSNQTATEKSWTSLWRTQIPSKLPVFFRNMAASSVCSICGETDSWRHSLIECNMSRCIWALAPESLWEHMERTSEPDAKQWIFTMIDSLPHEELTRCFVTLWAIWYARRKVLHEDRYQSPLSTHAFIDSFLHDLKISTPSREITRGAGAPAPTKRWLPPPVDHAKINVDAAVAKQVCAGAITAVCRDMDGRFLGASAQVIAGINDPGTLETLACREALSLAEDLQLAHLRVASDCLEAEHQTWRRTRWRGHRLLDRKADIFG
ncbi:hypothetical protein BRADI_3g07435v3, partial [Brachypodium distachyon]